MDSIAKSTSPQPQSDLQEASVTIHVEMAGVACIGVA